VTTIMVKKDELEPGELDEVFSRGPFQSKRFSESVRGNSRCAAKPKRVIKTELAKEREVQGSLPWPTFFYKTSLSEFVPLI